MNKVILVGNLTRDVEIKKTQSGKSVCEFSVAINTGKDTQAEFINCQAWEKTADVLGTFASKGSKLCIEGHLHVNSWEAQDGKKQYKTVVNADRIEFVSPKNTNENTNSVSKSQESIWDTQPSVSSNDADELGHTNGAYVEIKSDDLPFY